MSRNSLFLFLAAAVAATAGAGAQGHPPSTSKCIDCHTYGAGPADAPKVVPATPSFFQRLAGKKSYQGHASVSCTGTATADGKVTGCHRIESGGRAYLVKRPDQRPIDELCGLCHADQRKPGAHHPTYKSDKNRDGVPETIVRSAPTQQVYSTYAPSLRPEPLKSHPDAISFLKRDDGSLLLQSVLPLETVTEMVQDKPVTESNVVTCSTCHNPHFGYLVELGKEEPSTPTRWRARRETPCSGCGTSTTNSVRPATRPPEERAGPLTSAVIPARAQGRAPGGTPKDGAVPRRIFPLLRLFVCALAVGLLSAARRQPSIAGSPSPGPVRCPGSPAGGPGGAGCAAW